MKIPLIRGVIDRRILVNFQVDPAALSKFLPPPFRPQLAGGCGIAGVCLIRLKEIRPQFLPPRFGVSSENAAHRVAVEWNSGGETRTGVFIPRRDTSSRLNALTGGRLFPGEHQLACFDVREQGDSYAISLRSKDHQVEVEVAGRVASELPTDSVFHCLEEASAFFARGSVGYSVTPRPGRFDGLELRSLTWRVEPLAVQRVRSSLFSNEGVFPRGSVRFDCALLMRNIEHEWHAREPLCVCEPAAA